VEPAVHPNEANISSTSSVLELTPARAGSLNRRRRRRRSNPINRHNIPIASSSHNNNMENDDEASSIMEEDFFDAIEQSIHQGGQDGGHDNYADAVGEDGDPGPAVQDGDNEESSMSSSSSSSSETPSPRHRNRDRHSYLPGPSHPLLHDGSASRLGGGSVSLPSLDATMNESVATRRTLSSTTAATTATASTGSTTANSHSLTQSTTSTATTATAATSTSAAFHKKELAIMELPGMVLFPGCTIPIRLTNRAWIQHLGRQIDASRRVGSQDFGQTVQLGIVTQQNTPPIISGRRRNSLLRQGVGGRDAQRQQQRLSRILQQELLGISSDDDDDDSSDSSNDNHNNLRNRPRSVILHPFIGRTGTIATITCTHGDALLDQTRANSVRRSSTTTATTASGSTTTANSVWQQHVEDQSELILQAVGTTRFEVQSYLEFQSFADVQVFTVQEFQQDHRPLLVPSSSSLCGLKRRLPYDANRVETDEAKYDNHKDLQPHNNSATTNGTSNNGDTMSVSTRRSSLGRRHHSAIQTKYFVAHHEALIRQLSMVTPMSYLVYRQAWPWRLVGEMVDTIQEYGRKSHRTNNNHDGGDNLLTSLAELLKDKETSLLLDHPTQFSFWMASNMPLSIEDKLQLLQIPSTVERLLLLKKHLLSYTPDEETEPCAICCSTCQVPLSDVNRVFTVGGADGTTGNYVNEHGFIHQVVTLRQVDEQEVFCVGRASTENSYFPGYSWTITYCRRCGSLLGWKFHWVGVSVGDHGVVRHTRKESEMKNKPKSFFGFMSSSLITEQQQQQATNASDSE